MRVDLARQAAGGLGQGLDGGLLEHGEFAAGELEAVLDIGVDLVAGEAGEVVTHDEALAERCVHRHGDTPRSSVSPTRMRHRRFSESIAKLVSRRRSSSTSLRRWWASSMMSTGSCLASLARRETSVLIAWWAEERERSTAMPSSQSDGLVHVEHVAGGQRHVVHAIQPRVELGGEVGGTRWSCRRDLAGEHADALELDEVAEPGLGLAPRGGFEQLVGLCRGLEGQAGEGEVAQVHHSSSLRSRRFSGEGRGSGAGSPGSTCLE